MVLKTKMHGPEKHLRRHLNADTKKHASIWCDLKVYGPYLGFKADGPFTLRPTTVTFIIFEFHAE